MRNARFAIVWVIGAAALVSGRTAAADSPCVYTSGAAPGARTNVRVDGLPGAVLTIKLESDEGHSIDLSLDPTVDKGLNRVLVLGAGTQWHVSATEDKYNLKTTDGKTVDVLPSIAWTCGPPVTAKVTDQVVTGTTLANVRDSVSITITSIAPDARTPAARIQAASALLAGVDRYNAPASSLRSLDSTVPQAIQDALQLLAEIAVDRAKAEGLALLQEQIVDRVCTQLTIDKVFGGGNPSPLLPATCGQLQNLRLSDLGGSAKGLFDAIREDTLDVVLPAALAAAEGALKLDAASKKMLDATKVAVAAMVARAIDRGLRIDDVRTTLLAIAQSSDVPDRWKQAFAVALECATRSCSLGDIVQLVDDPTLAPIAQRLLAILDAPNDLKPPDPQTLASELINVVLDLAKDSCNSQAPCIATVDQIRDIATGLVEQDYMRALGGAVAMVQAANLAGKMKGKPLQLVASVAGYMQTYLDTQGKDAKEAHDERKQALEGLIDAGTDRSNRAGDWIVSIGASVGFDYGWQHVGATPSAPSQTSDQDWKDLRVPIGISVQHLPGDLGYSPTTWPWFLHVSVADLAQFVSSPVQDGSTMATSKTRWSDFVSGGAQVGFRLFSPRVPLVIGFEVAWIPRLTFADATGEVTTSVTRYGIFAGFNVPFFDLN